MSASSVSSCKTPPNDSPDKSSSSSSSNSSQESLDAQLSLPIPNPFYSPNGRNLYQPQEVVGSAQRSLVYKGLFYPYGLSTSGLQTIISVSMRAAKSEGIPSLVTQINRNRLVNDPYILRVMDEVVVDGGLWVVFMYLGPSLRQLFPNGVESSQIPMAVKSLFMTVTSLSSIHSANLVHGQVNLGHIYTKQELSAYQIGFGATVYESGPEEQELEKGFKRASKICEWASAPEVWFNGNNMAYHTSASDIWQVGITALELALGQLVVRNRQDLDALIDAAKTSWTSGLFGSVGFKSFLQVCLEPNPNMRPTSLMLRQHNFFRANNFGLAPAPGPN